MNFYRLKTAILCFLFLSNISQASNRITDQKVYWKSDTAEAYLLSKSPRRYLMKTSAVLRDNIPANKERIINTSNVYPQVISNSKLFDALYALSVNELDENSVEKINDAAFSPSDCHCFETGRKWNYVWTRDISYSAQLSLAAFNQQRTLNSLLFKVSKRRNGGPSSSEIVQDTGTGGSWPISSDRVVWSIAAMELIKYLDGKQRSSFIKTAYTALKNTVNNDRIAVYDKNDGLYTGEQSFLDWREQTYPSWTKTNVTHIGMSKSLSTNVTHYTALKATADLAKELGKLNEFSYYSTLAKDLKQSINKYFWDEDKGLYTTYLLTYLDQTKANKYDLLGNSMAIIFDVAKTERQKKALENYPMVMAGAPVITPQDPEAPVYHNRAIWPFVTQYGLLAAKKNKQVKIYNLLFNSMIRGTALNLSNMENYEFLSMSNWHDDGNLSGPVVNSQRQLWSVAAMLSTYVDGIFGKEVIKNKIRFQPFITQKIRNSILKNTNELTLKNFKYKNKLINVQIQLPSIKKNLSDQSYYVIKKILLNGIAVPANTFFHYNKLTSSNHIVITLGETQRSNDSAKILNINNPYNLSQTNYEMLFSPKTPNLYAVQNLKGNPHLNFNSTSFDPVTFNVYRNGKLVAKNLNSNSYTDKASSHIPTPCYVVEAVYRSLKNRSLHSEPHCFWRSGSINKIPVTHHTTTSQETRRYYADHGRVYLRRWGNENDKLEFLSHKVSSDGTYALQLTYNNLGEINTGITSAVKKVKVKDDKTGEVILEKVFMMPHHNSDRYWNDSNFVQVDLKSSTSYSIEVSDFYNMSYFEHFESYLYRGGRSGIYNAVNLTELKILRIK